MTIIQGTSTPAPSTGAPEKAPDLGTTRTRGHLRAVDVVRVITVAGVISVHTVANTTSYSNHLAGAVTSLLHVNREIFLLLSAFVLTYAYGHRPSWKLTTFWKRRYLLVVTPYVCWSAIYCGLNGRYSSVGQGFAQFGHDLLTGRAEFHLYFLLLTMQLYLFFPLLLMALKYLHRHHTALLVISFAAQVAFTSVFYYWPPSSGILGYWNNNATTDLLSYQFYIIAGAVAGLHFEQLAHWVAAHRRAVFALVGATLAIGLTNYYASLSFLHMNAAQASQVFQPLIAVEAVAFTVGLFGLGQWVEQRNWRSVLRVAHVGSDASFGVYLAHPLILLTLLFPALRAVGVLSAVKGAGVPVTLLFDVAIVIPLVYAISAVGAIIARRTPLSLALTGRPSLSEPKRAVARRTTPIVTWITAARPEPTPVGNSLIS